MYILSKSVGLHLLDICTLLAKQNESLHDWEDFWLGKPAYGLVIFDSIVLLRSSLLVQ